MHGVGRDFDLACDSGGAADGLSHNAGLPGSAYICFWDLGWRASPRPPLEVVGCRLRDISVRPEADHEPIPIRAFSCQRGSTVQADWRIEDNADAVKAFLCTKYPCQAGAFWEKSSESCRTCPFNGTSVRGQILGVGSCSCPSGRVFLYAVPPVPDRRCRHCGQRRGFSVSLPRMLVPCRVRHVLQPGRGRSEFGFSVFHRRDAAEYWMWARLGGASGMKPLRKPRVKQRQRRVPLSAGSWLPC
eukprot:258421-Rhodomonas_salina.2